MAAIDRELARGVLGAAQLRSRLGVSPATLMRLVQQAPSVLRLGRARATRYALRQAWPGLDATGFPLIRISEVGEAQPAGQLVTLASRQSAWLPSGEVFDGLPVELMDVRPQGFLGRYFVAQHADLALPQRVLDWSDHHVLLAQSRRGEDVPGNLIVGEESFQRWQMLPMEEVPRSEFGSVAEATLAGHPPGSSAGGERPKFGVFSGGRHVLVKFAARGGPGDSAARRWCDLLLLESLALEVASEAGVATARTAILETDTHVFLESERFDRIGRRGRRSVLSLAAVAEDPAASWAAVSARLHELGRLAADDARSLRWLDAFGALIANTDRHQYNVALLPAPSDALALAPVFDLLPMLYAPAADGLAGAAPMPRPMQTAVTLDVWDDARVAARRFWERAADELQLTDDLRRAAVSNASLLSREN